ncbi:hypothetical protein SUGI_0374760 [Cryptomeria japonica]|nr:hypothetical protein SUGI_0374760 [Cryptomeria japonica]
MNVASYSTLRSSIWTIVWAENTTALVTFFTVVWKYFLATMPLILARKFKGSRYLFQGQASDVKTAHNSYPIRVFDLRCTSCGVRSYFPRHVHSLPRVALRGFFALKRGNNHHPSRLKQSYLT